MMRDKEKSDGKSDGAMRLAAAAWPPALRARLTWKGCGLARRSESMRIGLAHRRFLAQCVGRAHIVLFALANRVAFNWPELVLELAQWRLPAPREGDRSEAEAVHRIGDVSPGGTAMFWKIAGPEREGDSLGHDEPVSRIIATGRLPEASTAPSGPDIAVRAVSTGLAHIGILAPSSPARLWGSPVHPRTAYEPLHPGRAAAPRIRYVSVDRVLTRANDEEDSPAPGRFMRGEARTDFSVRHSRTRETVPPPAAKGANTTGEAASAPLSLVDELAAWGERSLPLESLIFRAVPFPPADPPPPSGKRPAPDEGMEEVRYGAGAKSDPRPGPLNNFSRADIDLLARKVIRLIQRQERLERESKGML